jgi:hypothetical protein
MLLLPMLLRTTGRVLPAGRLLPMLLLPMLLRTTGRLLPMLLRTTGRLLDNSIVSL